MKYVLMAGIAACLCGIAVADDTESPSASAGQTFTPEDFEQFAPRTALDMVRQIPGFSIEEDDDGSRGFGQASGNVLINGQRISGKSNSPRDALGRIPAPNVEKIEVRDGATLDIPGLSGQVVNIIATVDGVSGTWTWRARWRENLPPFYDGIDASVTGRSGALAWTLGLVSEPGRGGDQGLEQVFAPDGTVTERREEAFTFISTSPRVSGSLAWTPANGHIANLNAEYALFEANEREQGIRIPLDGRPEARRLFTFSEDEWNTEIGGDYEFGIGPGRFKAIGLYRFEHSPTAANVFEATVDGSASDALRFEQVIDEGETIARGEYSWSPSDGRDWTISLEGAFNFLEADSAFFRGDAPTALVLQGDGRTTTRVEENRAELFVTHGRKLSEKLTVQAALGVELSEIMAGGASEAQTFTRPKGFLSAAYEVSDKLTINTKVEREVGQLNFFDFISSVNVSQGNSNTGNPEIVPQQSWLGEVEFERDLGDFGAGTLRFYYEDIEDIVDRIPFGPTSEGPGNLPSAERFGVELDATFKFDRIGWKGAQLQAEWELRQSSIEDPLTGEDRRINDDLTNGYFFELRHDIPNSDWAWGIAYERFLFSPVFRLDEVGKFENQPGFSYGFIEHKDVFGLTGTIFAGNLTDQDDQFTRQVFAPRRDGALLFTEDRTRNFGPILTIRLQGSF